MKDNIINRIMTEIEMFRAFAPETREVLARFPSLVATTEERPRRRRRRVKEDAPKKKLHWTQRPENAKRVKAMLKKAKATRYGKK